MVKELEDKAPAGASIRRSRPLGLPDDAFQQRRPLRGQITKAEVRAVSLYFLGLRHNSVVWDIGAGTGSVAIEAALISHEGDVYAVERNIDSLPLLEQNIARWGGGNINLVSGEAPEILDGLPAPDSVFVGGSSGRLPEILHHCVGRLNLGGAIVVNLAALERTQEAYKLLKDLGLDTELAVVSASRGKEMPDGALRLESLNPIFVVSAKRKA